MNNLRNRGWNMTKMMQLGFSRLLLASLLVVMASSAAYAANFYVAKTGSDGNDGSSGTPWLTIGRCASTLVAGDTCIIRDGTYAENVTEAKHGTSGSRIVYQAEHKWLAVVGGSFTVSGDYVTVDGLKFVLPTGADYGVGVSGAGNLITNVYVTTNVTTLGLNNWGISATGSGHTISSSYVEKTCLGVQLDGSNMTLETTDITRLTQHTSCGDNDFTRAFGPGHVVRGNRFYDLRLEDLGQNAHPDCLQTFDGGRAGVATNLTVENNYCEGATQGFMVSATSTGNAANLLFRNNVVNVAVHGAVINDAENVQFFNNTFNITGALGSGTGTLCYPRTETCGGFRTSCEWKNNIYNLTGPAAYFYGDGGVDCGWIIDGTHAAPGKNNLLYKSGTTIEGYANDLKNQAPGFANPPARDFRVSSRSPAVDAGIAIAGWLAPTDKDGLARPQGIRWDIGAHEYGGALSPPANLRIIK